MSNWEKELREIERMARNGGNTSSSTKHAEEQETQILRRVDNIAVSAK